MPNLKFAILGTGFWANYQLAAWQEIGGVDCVALYNRTRSKAEKMAQRFGIPRVYDDAEAMLASEQLDFVDIITDVDTHEQFTRLAAQHKLAVICQKPMAPALAIAEGMVLACKDAGVPFFIHENWRWQTPIRAMKLALDSGVIGSPFRARIDMISRFPGVQKPAVPGRALSSSSSRTWAATRWTWRAGCSAKRAACIARRAAFTPNIKGEDMATMVMDMAGKTTVTVNMAYAENYLEHDRFPETYLFVEGDKGTMELGPDYWLRVTTQDGTLARRVPPPRFAWADPAYDVAHASIAACNADLLKALKGDGPAETTGEDNLKTVRLVFASYESAARNEVVHF